MLQCLFMQQDILSPGFARAKAAIRRQPSRSPVGAGLETNPKAVSPSSSVYPGIEDLDDGRTTFEPLAAVAVVSYLETFGLQAVDAATWRVTSSLPSSPARAADSSSLSSTAPRLELEVPGHVEIQGHTWYILSCQFVHSDSSSTSWSLRRRLNQLREELHDAVKRELGGDYSRHFGKTPFALKGGLPGTTSRLNSWCACLATLINTRKLSPALAALVLQYVGAPLPDRTVEPSCDGTDIDIALEPDEDELLASEGLFQSEGGESSDWGHNFNDEPQDSCRPVRDGS